MNEIIKTGLLIAGAVIIGGAVYVGLNAMEGDLDLDLQDVAEDVADGAFEAASSISSFATDTLSSTADFGGGAF